MPGAFTMQTHGMCGASPQSLPCVPLAKPFVAHTSVHRGASGRRPGSPRAHRPRRGARPHCSAHSPTLAPDATPQPSPTTPGPTGQDWELDFCSRPMLDERGKRVWELLICEPGPGGWRHVQVFPNNKINSGELGRVLQALLTAPGARKPERARFFRGQMQTIISRALADQDIVPLPSRRCYTLYDWLAQRAKEVYPAHPRFSPLKAGTRLRSDWGPVAELPPALRGEAWSFVQLPMDVLLKEYEDVDAGRAFGSRAPVPEGTGQDTLVPGVAVYSRRAGPLAAWTAGLELCGVVADTERAGLVLQAGVSQQWRYGRYGRSEETSAEAEAWQAAKADAGGLHFLAIMASADAETCSGLWILCDPGDPAA
ncbi:TAB2 [Auxenochlorella protothecoides x Auxenochlorella symbiontica]